MDTRNVIDYYKYWTTDAIKADLDLKRHDFTILISNQFHDFNIGTVLRCANAFLAKEVVIWGRKKYDRRGTVGMHHYENLRHVSFTEELSFDCPVIGVDNVTEAVPVEDFQWPKKCVLAFGQEDVGLPEEFKAICETYVYIKQYGSVRSLNVGVASGIIMQDYCRKLTSM
jgi:tRNA G18 (ribose-2'-O)-methylase SpoU